MSSRCTTSRSYSGPRSRARSRVERPRSSGNSRASKLTKPRATTRPVSSNKSIGSPATNVPETAVMPAGNSDARRTVTASTAPASKVTFPDGVVACSSQSNRVDERDPWDGTRFHSSQHRALTRCSSRLRAVWEFPPPWRSWRPAPWWPFRPGPHQHHPRHRSEHRSDPRHRAPRERVERPGDAVVRRTSHRHRRAGRDASACTTWATNDARRSLSPNRISSVATVSFSLTIGSTPSSSSRNIVRCALR